MTHAYDVFILVLLFTIESIGSIQNLYDSCQPDVVCSCSCYARFCSESASYRTREDSNHRLAIPFVFVDAKA